MKKFCHEFNYIHVLPFFPFTSDDGFAVKDYTKIDEKHGKWSDLEKITSKFNVMIDLVINHCSAEHQLFRNFLNSKNPGLNFFITFDKIPKQLSKVIKALEKIQKDFNSKKRSVSIADLIVLGGSVGIEKSAKAAGHKIKVPFTHGRGDASQDQTDIHSFGLLEPQSDGFRNYVKGDYSLSAEEMLIDRANLMKLTAPEMTVLIGGLRAININFDNSDNGVFTKKPGKLTNDFFVNLLDMNTTWKETSDKEDFFEGRDRKTGKVKWLGTRADLIFGSNSQLRAIAEVYACEDSKDKFLSDFVAAWIKVMNLDRFDKK